jgi:hypothetical protein
MPLAGFELTIPVSEMSQTHAVDGAAARFGTKRCTLIKFDNTDMNSLAKFEKNFNTF